MEFNLAVNSFENFIASLNGEFLLEASTLSKTGMPKKMISAIYQKAGPFSETYPRMAHTYRSKVAIPMPYKYYTPEHDIEITEPIIAVGRKTNVDPYSGRTINSQYTDFHWFIESLPYGPNRALVTNPDLDFYMYIYDKSASKGATGMQYAILWWDSENQKAVDFGYSELTTREVDLEKIRKVHDTKGGNTSMKIQEFVRSATRKGDKAYSPSASKPLYLYKLKENTSSTKEKRESRAQNKPEVTSIQFLSAFADRYSSLLPKIKPATLSKLQDSIAETGRNMITISSFRNNGPAPIQTLAKNLAVNPGDLVAYLFQRFKDFRKEIFEEGRGRLEKGTSAYGKTSGFELDSENKFINSFCGTMYASPYSVQKKTYSPDEEMPGAENLGYREAQPEKYKRDLPVPGEYASIQSIIRKHSLDGAMSRFAYFMLTDKIKFPEVSVASILGIEVADSNPSAIPDDDNWLY